MTKHAPCRIDPKLPYSHSLAAALNEYWRDTVAVPDGGWNVHTLSKYGVPDRASRKHPAIIRVVKYGSRWEIVR